MIAEQHDVMTRARALELLERHRAIGGKWHDETDAKAHDVEVLDSLSNLFRQPIAAEPPEVKRVGLGYRATFPSGGVEMMLERIRESRGEVHGELAVRLHQGAADFGDGHLFGARFNVSSLSARTAAAKYLNGRVQGDWLGMLERFCMLVLHEERRGQEFEHVGQRPRQGPAVYLMPPLLPYGTATILFGAGGTGKSTLAAGIAVATATGRPVMRG
jgi:hypothetical protein